MFLEKHLVEDAVVARFDLAKQVIKTAGELALDYFERREELVIETKAEPQDVVSIADKNVEQIILRQIQEAYPKDNFLGEEQGILKGDNDYLWVVDPIDGTSCFVHGMPSWCISIALMQADKIAFGLVYDPNADELFTALSGNGCQVNGKAVKALNIDSVQAGVMGVGTSHRVSSTHCLHFLQGLLDEGGMFIRNGSGALMLAYVAAGRLIGYYEPHINSWDCLAGLILVQEAGGSTNRFLENDGLLEGNSILVSAKKIHHQLDHFTRM
ncbi:inositol monophosphatase family protein [Marinomonas sp. PE14-40]|uniref:inositol monophosphatase family protein n=1 Tax=Marinomonas sp. PE14-40 TaxID=3060621 RepID=UPI003F6816A9